MSYRSSLILSLMLEAILALISFVLSLISYLISCLLHLLLLLGFRPLPSASFSTQAGEAPRRPSRQMCPSISMFLGFRPLPPSLFSSLQLSLSSLEQVLGFPPSAADPFQTTCTANVSLASLRSCEACATYPLQSVLIGVTPFAAGSREQASGDTLPPSAVVRSGSSEL